MEINFSRLAELVAQLEIAESVTDRLNAEIRELVEPKPPMMVNSPAEWEQFQQLKNNIKQKKELLNEQNQSNWEWRTKTEKEIMSMIPPHVWFKIELEDKTNRWIGITTSNWGGYSAAVTIQKTEPTERLKHYNYN